MVQLNEKVLNDRKKRLKKRINYGGITPENLETGLSTANAVQFLMDHDNDAVLLHLENLINTYGVGKVKKHFNALTKTKLKKAV